MQGFQSTMDPEELFRRIFEEGTFGSKGSNPFSEFSGSSGFSTTKEFIMNLSFQQAARGVNKEVKLLRLAFS